MIEVKKFEFNPVSENTYVVYDGTKECVIIDPGCFSTTEQKELADFIKKEGLTVKHLLCTHLHFDHVFGINFVTEAYNVPLEASKEDEILLDKFEDQLKLFGFPKLDGKTPVIGKYLKEGDKVTFGKRELDVISIPGHSPGSLVFYNKEYEKVFVGDVLFKTSIGRTDLEGGDHSKLIRGIRDKLLMLPDTTIVYSGHGPETTIGYEKANNPYLQ